MSEREGAYGTIVVVGGGCYGSYYVRQLGRARDAGKLVFDRILVVDHDPHCAAPALGANLEVASWTDFFNRYFDSQSVSSNDAIVPSPLMPHLMYEWVRDRAKARWADRDVGTVALPVAAGTPWSSAAPDGTGYASYATWTCPVNCIEPRVCPHTRGERDWTMPAGARAMVERAREEGISLSGPIIFHCTHRAFGVGMFDTRDVVAADSLIRSLAETSPADILVGTVSHCHGAFNVLHVGATTS